MFLRRTLLVGACLITAISATAHQGVTNPAVKARMDAMVKINAEMKAIQHIAKGKAPFNQAKAAKSIETIVTLSAKTPDLFRDQQDDPMSEALPAIWSDFDKFTRKAIDMEQAARSVKDQLSSEASLRSALRSIGTTCKACHDDYRKK